MIDRMNGAAIAIMAAGLLGAACDKKDGAGGPGTSSSMSSGGVPSATTAGEKTTAKMFCGGVNDCSGKSACKTAKNDCKGKNACKGQGVLEMTAEECKAKGGSVQPKTM